MACAFQDAHCTILYQARWQARGVRDSVHEGRAESQGSKRYIAAPQETLLQLLHTASIFAGLIVAQAAEQLGQEVLLRHFLVTVRGRTGYLEPQWEDCSITGTALSLAALPL